MSDTWRILGREAKMDAVLAITPQAITDATPVLSDAIDVRLYPGQTILLVALYNEVGATTHTMAFTVTESATSGGSYTPSVTSGTLTATSADFVQFATIARNEAMPFIKVTATGSNADVDGIAGATVLFLDDGRAGLNI
jgi:hypothetical protein